MIAQEKLAPDLASGSDLASIMSSLPGVAADRSDLGAG